MRFFHSQNKQSNSGFEHLNTQITTLHDLIAQAMQKKEEEKQIAEEQAAKERYWKIPNCVMMNDDNYNTTGRSSHRVISTDEPLYENPLSQSQVSPKVIPKWLGCAFHDNSPPLDISQDQNEDSQILT
ncbi:hypothetical protein Tco_0007868 [Tanacetum coccineum]